MTPLSFFGGWNPRVHQVNPFIRQEGVCDVVNGVKVTTFAYAGGAEGQFSIRHPALDLVVSGKTHRMGRNQEDSFCAVLIESERGHFIIAALADGVSGCELGELASSAFIQGVCYGVLLQMAGTVPLRMDAHAIYEEGCGAISSQSLLHSAGSAATTGLVMVISATRVHSLHAGDTLPIVAVPGRGLTWGECHTNPKNPGQLLRAARLGLPESNAWPLTPGMTVMGASDGLLYVCCLTPEEDPFAHRRELSWREAAVEVPVLAYALHEPQTDAARVFGRVTKNALREVDSGTEHDNASFVMIREAEH